MKMHFLGTELNGRATIGQIQRMAPACGAAYAPARGTYSWDRVDCKKCLVYRPHALRAGQAVRHSSGSLGIITESPAHSNVLVPVMFLGEAGVLRAHINELTPVTLGVTEQPPNLRPH